MSDQTDVAPSEEVQGQEQSSDQEPQFLTKAEFDNLIAERSKDIEEQAFRRAQSLLGKQYGTLEGKFDKRFEEVKTLLKSANIELTPEQMDKMEIRALLNALREQPEDGDQPQPAQDKAPQRQEPSTSDLDAINKAAARMYEQSGVTITPEENNALNSKVRSGEEYLVELARLIASKQSTSSTEVQEEPNPEARIVGGGTGSSPAPDRIAKLSSELEQRMARDPMDPQIVKLNKELTSLVQKK